MGVSKPHLPPLLLQVALQIQGSTQGLAPLGGLEKLVTSLKILIALPRKRSGERRSC